MTHFWRRLAMMIVINLTAMTTLIQAVPYDNDLLGELLAPPDCSAPCFMGIRPGVTTLDETMRILTGHSWVKQVENMVITGFPVDAAAGWLLWEWSGEQPAWIDSSQRGEVQITQGRVKVIRVGTYLQLGEVKLMLGVPDRELMMLTINQRRNMLIYQAAYGHYAFESRLPCRVKEPYLKTVVIEFHALELLGNFASVHFQGNLFNFC